MLSVCFRMKVITHCFASALTEDDSRSKKEAYPERNGKKLEKCISPATQVTLHHAPTTQRTFNNAVEKEIHSWQWGGSLKERVTTAAARAVLMEMPGPCILGVGDKRDSEVSHSMRDISDGKDLVGHLSIPLPRQDYAVQNLPKKIAQEQFHMSRGME